MQGHKRVKQIPVPTLLLCCPPAKLQVCAAVAIIVITATKFSNFQDVTAAGNDLVSVTINQSCALGQFSTGW
jgi:hypothetical protein